MIFRANDIRGKAGQELNSEIVVNIGRAFASEMVEAGESQLIVGRDNRVSSHEFSDAVMRGARAGGLNTVDIGEVATPMLYHASVTDNDAPAIMITGSHLPPDQNGLKMTQGVIPFFGDDIQRLRARIEQGDYVTGGGKHRADHDAVSRYMDDVRGRIDTPGKRFKIVVDAGNGMAGGIAPLLLRELGHEVIELFCDSDGTYPNHPADPTVEGNLRELRGAVVSHHADIGLAFDGDADRVGVMDGSGTAQPTDRVLIPLIWDILKNRPGATIVVDPLVSSVLAAMIRASGGVVDMWKTGHSNIKTRMKEVGATLGLETSGHVFIAGDYYGYDDGIFTALRLVEILARERTASLADIMAEVPQLAITPQYRPSCPEKIRGPVIEAVRAHFQDCEINDVDGVRVTLPDGWFIIRASNTEAKLSLRFEGKNQAALEKMVNSVENIMDEFGIRLR